MTCSYVLATRMSGSVTQLRRWLLFKVAHYPRSVRALLAFLVLPGVVAFAVPALLVWPEPAMRAPRTIGLIPFITGVFLLIWCVRDFYVAGKGTLAPWD